MWGQGPLSTNREYLRTASLLLFAMVCLAVAFVTRHHPLASLLFIVLTLCLTAGALVSLVPAVRRKRSQD